MLLIKVFKDLILGQFNLLNIQTFSWKQENALILTISRLIVAIIPYFYRFMRTIVASKIVLSNCATTSLKSELSSLIFNYFLKVFQSDFSVCNSFSWLKFQNVPQCGFNVEFCWDFNPVLTRFCRCNIPNTWTKISYMNLTIAFSF